MTMDTGILRYNLVGAKVDDSARLSIFNSHLHENYFCQVKCYLTSLVAAPACVAFACPQWVGAVKIHKTESDRRDWHTQMIAGENATLASLVCQNTSIIEGPAEGQSPVWLPFSQERPGFLQLNATIVKPHPDEWVDPMNVSQNDPMPVSLRQLRDGEWNTHSRLMRLDVATELAKLAQEERELSDSEEELQRLLDKIDDNSKAELERLEALPEYQGEGLEGDIALLSPATR